jgi:hypothetical protein
MWRELISKHCSACVFRAGVADRALHEAERSLGIALPLELRSLLSDTDGVEGEYGLSLVWPLDRIVEDNLRFRSQAVFRKLYMPFDALLFFADAGNGDQFAFCILDGEVRRSDVYAWDHEDDSRSWLAGSLRSYIDGQLSGSIRVCLK